MLFARLPDESASRPPQAYPWGRQTIIIHDRTQKAVYGRHTAPLSLKTVLKGTEHYNVHGFFETVTPGECLVVNSDQMYESAIDEDEPTETLCVFFCESDLSEATQTLVDSSLDRPSSDPASLRIFSATKRRQSPRLQALLRSLPSLRCETSIAQESVTLALLSAAAELEHASAPARHCLENLRSSTRKELHRRCEIGLAFMKAVYGSDVTLAHTAAVAGLSRTHFLRAFKAFFGETPYKALQRIRMEQAVQMLMRGQARVSEVAVAVGYSDFSAFSRAFRAHHGISPTKLLG